MYVYVDEYIIIIFILYSLQQSGRAGRRNTDSLTMVVADQSPMDQFYVVKLIAIVIFINVY